MTQPISVIAKSLVRERARTGLSLAEVARRAGIAKSTLSQLESGNGNPSLETLWSLCVALDIPFARLLEPQVNKTQVIRRGEGTKVVAEQANYQAILLAACPPGARRDIYLLLTQPGADNDFHHWESRLDTQLGSPLAALAKALLTQSATRPGGIRAENLLATVQQRHPDASDDEARALFVRLRDILLRDAYWLADDSSGGRHYRFALEPLRRWWHRRNSL